LGFESQAQQIEVMENAEMKKGELAFAFLMLAERTGLEPATPGVTGRYSNQLNYRSLRTDSNPTG
jgi:hypothetical protein